MIDFGTVKEITIPEGVVLKIMSGSKLLWEKIKFTNQVPYSTESDGVTIYNGGLGYKNGYRVRSGGAEAAISTASCTGYIKVSPGDIIRLSGWDFSYVSTANAINASDSGFTNLGQITGTETDGYSYGIFAGGGAYEGFDHKTITEETTGVWKWIVPPAASGVAYIRVSGYTDGDGSGMIVTVNEEIE